VKVTDVQSLRVRSSATKLLYIEEDSILLIADEKGFVVSYGMQDVI